MNNAVDESGVLRFDRAAVDCIWDARFEASGSGAECKPADPPVGSLPAICVCLPDGEDAHSSAPLLCVWVSDEKGDVRGGAMVGGGKRFTDD